MPAQSTLFVRCSQPHCVNGQAGVDSGDLGSEEVAAMFGTTKGYKIEEPNVVPKPDEDASEDDDF